ncbi:plasminogen-binding N-terminal domain-containing protein [Helicobacter sp. 13S00477-4]|uniref:plasminogen-binding N-terminal domain-containing protein n=1 Tax=Helicobacter sp. 13S00477-4 TaxID=1905759 RepID=UPI000BA6F84A|nr:plasminogen-binding N-terminal domain-containing protein [Helicobacter sp. 13S00477-4]PAF52806.1 hypothetical protein BKH44_01080 [Helicobacter sp. 13S00477-4]
MLKRFLNIIVFVSIVCVQAQASWLNEPLRVNIQEVNKDKKTISFPAYDLKVGESGFVLVKLADYSAISAKLQIISIDNGVAVAEFSPFDRMKQKYLPTPRLEPKVGDMAVFRDLNNKAFLIAPDSTTYEKIKSQIKDTTFMSSDLLMGYLNDYGGFDPKPKFLRKACEVYSVGLLYVVASNGINVLDCETLATLDTFAFDTSKVSKTSAPFFSRLEEVKTGSLASLFYSKKSKQYFQYYDALVQNNQASPKEENPKKSRPKKEP